jgi:hypothetical protein
VTSKLSGGVLAKLLTSLLGKGLIKEVGAKRDETVWRQDDNERPLTLAATLAARAACKNCEIAASEIGGAAGASARILTRLEPASCDKNQTFSIVCRVDRRTPPPPVITFLMLHMLLSLQEAYFLANLRGLPVSCSKRFVAETVARAISPAAVMKISPAPFRG